jgi:hypothetical protein
MMSNPLILVSWSEALDAHEAANPRSFDFFYQFHTIHDILEEKDLHPYQRLIEINEHSPVASKAITSDIILSIRRVREIAEDAICYNEDGFSFQK